MWLLLAVILAAGRDVSAQRLPALREVDPEARIESELAVPITESSAFALLERGVAVLSADGRRVATYGGNGSLLWQAPAPEPLSGLAGAPGGGLVLGISAVDEDTYFHVLFAADGTVLWTRTLGSPLEFTPSGRFLVTTYDASDSSQPAAAFRAETGELVWTDSSNPSYWHLDASARDTLAYYRRDALQLVDLGSGRVLWTRVVDADPRHDAGKVLISLDGRTVVVQSRHEVASRRRRRTEAYDASGDRLWHSVATPVPGVSNGGLVTGLSLDGSLIALADLDEFALVRASDGAKVAVLPERIPCCVAAFTPALLVLGQGGRTRLLHLDSQGRPASDRTLDDPLLFRFEPGPGPTATGELGSYRAYAIERRGPTLHAARLDFDPTRRQR
jgi:outer membrane protein assembly factor BamB